MTRKKKSDIPVEELQQSYLTYINECASESEIIKHYYTDGSAHDGLTVAACIIPGNAGTQKVRLRPFASSTRAEIFAILLALKEIDKSGHDALIITDSQSAIQVIKTSKIKRKIMKGLANRVAVLIKKIRDKGYSNIFL